MSDKRILKYVLTLDQSQEIIFAGKTTILSVHNQDDIPILWAIVDTNFPPETKTILGYMTGQKLTCDDNGKFIGTVILLDGSFVIHYFEKGEDNE